MNGNVELLRAVIIVTAVIGSYRIAELEGGVSAGVGRIRASSLYVGVAVFTVSFISSLASSLTRDIGVNGIEMLACFLSVSVCSLILYRVGGKSGREKYASQVYASSIFLSTMLLTGETGDTLHFIVRGAVYGGYFISALLLFSRIRYRTDESESCECFRGLPVYLLSGAFLSYALHGILKVWEKLFT